MLDSGLRSSITARLLLALVIALAAIASTPVKSHAACVESSGRVGSVTVSTQSTASAFVICGSSSGTSSTTSGSASSSTGTKSSATATPVFVPTKICRIITKRVAIGDGFFKYIDQAVCITNAQLPVAATTTKTISAPTTQVASSTASDQNSFAPDSISLSTAKQVVAPGTRVEFATIAPTHYRTGSILGQVVDVRFTPVQVQWDFGGGPEPWLSFDSGASVGHAFQVSGSQAIRATVRFQAAFRFAGQAAWTLGSTPIPKSADVTVIVAASVAPIAPPPTVATKPIKSKVRLVARVCHGASVTCP